VFFSIRGEIKAPKSEFRATFAIEALPQDNTDTSSFLSINLQAD
jgi:hypothetical protein